jgi:hypothetical protein
MHRRHLLATVPALTVVGCAAVSPATIAAAGALAITTIAGATKYWGTVKGEVQIAIAGVSVANPALGAALAGALTVGDTLLAALPSVVSDATALANGILTLIQHGAALITQAGTNIRVISNGITT